jgi:hypothetical protein
MRRMSKMQTRERRGPSPGQTFATWIDCNTVELNVRKVAPAFAEWINSGGQDFDPWSGLKKIFLELTQLSVDHIRAQRLVRGRGYVKRYRTGLTHVKKINAILMWIQEQFPVGLHMSDWPNPDGMPMFLDRPIVTPAAKEKGSEHALFEEAHAASYALKQFRFLADRRAFADFRHCALPTCRKLFFPLRPERLYCSDACQGKYYMKDPLRAKRNAAAQKVNYYAKKVLTVAKLAKNPHNQQKLDHAKKMLKLAERAHKKLKSTKRAERP